MTSRAPGDRLHRVLGRIVDGSFFRSAIEPTIADLQHELSGRVGIWRRGLSYVRCAIAIGRLLTLCPSWRWHMGRIAAVVVLGAGGAGGLVWEQSVGVSGPIGLMPFFMVAVFAAITLRVLELGRSYREMFVNCIGISLLMSLGLARHYGRLIEVPLWVAGRAVLAFVLCFGLASALVASVAWKPRGGRSGFQRGAFALVIGLCVFVLAQLGGLALLGNSITGVAAMVIRSAYMAFLFALVSSITLLPLLGLARLLVRRRWALALVAAAGLKSRGYACLEASRKRALLAERGL